MGSNTYPSQPLNDDEEEIVDSDVPDPIENRGAGKDPGELSDDSEGEGVLCRVLKFGLVGRRISESSLSSLASVELETLLLDIFYFPQFRSILLVLVKFGFRNH